MAELDPVKSVRVMLHKEPGFFGSEPFQRSLESGEFLSLDYEYFATYIRDAIISGGDRSARLTREEQDQSEALRRVLEDFVGEEPLQKLCDHFLPYLDDGGLFDLMRDVRDHQLREETRAPSAGEGIADQEKQLQTTLARLVIVECRWRTLDDVLLANALALFSPRLVKYLTALGEEGEEVGEAIMADLEKEGLALTSREEKETDLQGHWALRRSLLSSNDARSREDEDLRRRQCRFICMETFLLRYRLMLDFVDERALKKIMKKEGIRFHSVYVTKEKKRKRTKKKKISKKVKELVGWRFPAAPMKDENDAKDKEVDSGSEGGQTHRAEDRKKRKRKGSEHTDPDAAVDGRLTYGVVDTPAYLVSLFTRSAISWFDAHHQ